MSEPLCDRVFVFGLDGAIGECVCEARTPNIDALLADGAMTCDARSVLPSASFQAWGALFHGVGPDTHQLPRGDTCPEDVAWPSFTKIARQQRPDIKIAAFSCWGPINTHIIEPSVKAYCESKPDPDLVALAVDYIRKDPPDIFFMQLDHIDGAGHGYGYRTEKYLQEITNTDALVGKVIDAIQDAGAFDRSLIVVTSDHGGIDHSHGSDHPDCMSIFWGARGPGIRKGAKLDGMNIMDTAAAAAHALGLPAPKGWEAKVPDGLFI